MSLIYKDETTKKRITYRDTDLFKILISNSNGQYRVVYTVTHHDLALIISRFWSLDIPKTQTKKLMQYSQGEHSGNGTVIYRLRGEAPPLRKNKEVSYEEDTICIKFPSKILRKFNLADTIHYPEIGKKWSRTYLINCLLAYFFTLSNEDQAILLELGDKEFKKEIKGSNELL